MTRLLFFAVLTLTISLTCSELAFGQQYTGCYRSATSRIYYGRNGNSGGRPNYNLTPYVTFSAAFCKVSLGSACRVNNSGSTTGVEYTFYMTQCPIDDYAFLLLFVVGGAGCWMIKKRGTFNVTIPNTQIAFGPDLTR